MHVYIHFSLLRGWLLEIGALHLTQKKTVFEKTEIATHPPDRLTHMALLIKYMPKIVLKKKGRDPDDFGMRSPVVQKRN